MAGPQGNGALLASIKESQEQASAGELNRTSQSRNSAEVRFSHTLLKLFLTRNTRTKEERGMWVEEEMAPPLCRETILVLERISSSEMMNNASGN